MKPDVSLELVVDGRSVFTSHGKWLHPLFELEAWLRQNPTDVSRAEIHDKIVGRGSAFLITRLGIRKVHAGLLSRLGKDVFDRRGITCSWDLLLDEIECRTEGLLREVTDVDAAYRILSERAEAARRRQGVLPPAG
ncbi:MAG TPA: DUF1893 domain-containing protein [Spirochaetia bacterium]|nr:DUF1893 domain-containing protein [Spirochaetia bacterium]